MKTFKLSLGIFPALLLAGAVLADPNQYAATSIAGQVLEAGATTPVAGVIVTANWELVDSTKRPVGQAMVMETVTDQNGHFSFPAWGPKSHPAKTNLDPKAPQLLFFKEGYEYRRLFNQAANNANNATMSPSAWNGKTVEMRRLTNDAVVNLGPGRTISKHSLSLNGLGLALDWAYRGKDCEWKQAPRMLAAAHRTKLEFDHQGLRTDLKFIDDLPASKKCGAPQDFLRVYLP